MLASTIAAALLYAEGICKTIPLYLTLTQCRLSPSCTAVKLSLWVLDAGRRSF